jgi:hypothetical protein
MARPVSCQVDLEFTVPVPAVKPVNVIQIPKALSLMNRKSWRSGYVYSVDYIEYIGNAGDQVTIFKIPEGYVSYQSWKNGFAIWRRQRSNAMDNEGSSPGRWSDFKCWMSEKHFDGSFGELNPLGMTVTGISQSALSTAGAEWNMAELIVNDSAVPGTTVTYNVGMLGGHAFPYGALIQGWGDTRAGTVAPDPNQPGELSISWLSRTGEESSDMSVDVLNLVESENDNPPYANETDPALAPIYVGGSESAVGGVGHDSALVGTTGRAVGLSGGLFPLGYIGISIGGAGSDEVERLLRVHVSRGKYKGVLAMKVGDFR